MSLTHYGWSAAWADAFAAYGQEGYSAGRIIEAQKTQYRVGTEAGELSAVLTGKYLYEADSGEALPAVGDWAVIRLHDAQEQWATVHALLPRHSAFIRKEAGARLAGQVVAANVDTALIVVGLDRDYNPRRIERYLALAWESGADPAVLLTKDDLCADVAGRLASVAEIAPGVPVHAVSVPHGLGLEILPPYLQAGRTLVLLGSSGAGKSTLVNHLLGGAVQRVRDVRDDDSRGRHTTTHRQLFCLPGGASIIDTPGMRELQLWNVDEGLDAAFADIARLAARCQYADCRHEQEPGCAVQQALDDGELDAEHFENYLKMRRELDYLASREDEGLERERKRRAKQLGKLQKAYQQRHHR